VCAGGAVLGLAVAALSLPALQSFVPETIPRRHLLEPDFSFLWRGVLVAVMMALGGAVVPALRLSGRTISVSLKSVGLSVSRRRSWGYPMMIGGQTAFATALITATWLLLVSFWKLVTVPTGFDPHQLVVVEVGRPDPSGASAAVPRTLVC